MSAGFSPASLRRLRSWATGLMTDECRIVSHGRPVTDPHTGKATSPETVRYEGRCKVQTSGGLAAENTEGGIVQALGAVTVFCQVVIGQCGVSFPSEKAVGFSPVRNWPVIARVLLFHCIRA